MAFVNYVNKEINAKIVYYGPGLSGKTTNIVYIHKKLNPNSRGKLISLATQTDRTLFFDFLPINLGEVSGYKVRFHLYTVPGQIFYNTTRKMVLKGVDGIVFVADSQKQMMEDNIESLKNLEDNLKEYGKNLQDIPFVIQYNKRDLPEVMDLEEMHLKLNKLKAPFFQAVATEGKGVLETLTAICRMVMSRIKDSTEFAETFGDEEKKEKEKPREEPPSKGLFLPEDYSEEAMKMLDLLGENEGEELKEEKSEEEEIEEELELFEEKAEEQRISFEEINKPLFSVQAIGYSAEKGSGGEIKIELQNPSVIENEIEIPLKFNLGDREKSVKIKLKIKIEEE